MAVEKQASAGAYQRLMEHTRRAHQQAAPGHDTGGLGEVYISASKELARRMHRKVSGSSDEGRGMCVQKMKGEREGKRRKKENN